MLEPVIIIPALELSLQKVEECFLHHVSDFVALERGSNDDNGPHRGHHVVGRTRFLLLEKWLPLLLAPGQSPGGGPSAPPRV